jgi:hypothetical protein
VNAYKLRERENSLPLIEINSPDGNIFSGIPTWIKTNKGKNALSVEASIPKGGILFPIKMSVNGIEEIIRLNENNQSINGYKVFFHHKTTKTHFNFRTYFYKNENSHYEPTPTPKLELVKEWEKIHSPFTGKYRKGIETKNVNLFGEKETEWIQIEKKLSKELIYKARIGQAKIGYFSTLSPDIVGIDLDFHDRQNPWSSKELPRTLEAYENLVLAIRFHPSIVYRSPRGIHIFFKFNTRAPWELLRDRIREGLEDLEETIHAEILPSPTSSLRIDSIHSYLNPITLENIDPPKLEEIKTYSIAELYGYDLEDWKKPSKKRERSYSLKKQATLESLEESILPITKSNQLFKDCPLLPAYFKSGLSIKQAGERIIVLLNRSGYSRGKELLANPKRLEEKLKSSWDNFKRKSYVFEGIKKERQLELRDIYFIECLLYDSPFTNVRIDKFKKFLENLLGWIRYQQNLTQTEKEWFSFFYTYRNGNTISGYRIFSKKGWIPIPSKMLWKIDRRYKDFLSFLESKGVLKIETGYSIEKSQCRYFSFRDLVEIKGGKDPNQFFIDHLRELRIPQGALGELLEVKQYTISRLLLGELSREKTTYLREKWEKCHPSKIAVLPDSKEYAKSEKHI